MPRIPSYADDLLNVVRRGTWDNINNIANTKLNTRVITKSDDFLPDNNRYNQFMPNEMIKWKKFDNHKKYLRGEFSPNGGEFNASIRSRYPHYRHYKLLQKTNEMAKRFGFKNEAELAKEIEAAAKLCKTANGRIIVNNNPKMRNLFSHLSRLKNKSTIVKGALLAGTISGMVIYLAKIQSEQSGCFRYNLDNREQLVKYKMAGNFCLGDVHDESTEFLSKDLIVIPENSHPLFEKNKWDCEFKDFKMTSDVDRERIYNITSLGCNGLCNVENFNILTSLTDDDNYDKEINDVDNEYTFVCERATFLRTLTEESINYISEVADGVIESNIFKGVFDNIYKYIIFLIIFIISIKIILGSRSIFFLNNSGGGGVE